MRNAMLSHFDLRKSIFENGKKFLFQTPYVEKEKSSIHYGEIDDEGYILWEPQIKNTIHYFNEIEQRFTIELNQDIKEYFNSYWFENIDGFIKKYYINLIPVKPNLELIDFENRLENYQKYFDNELKFIPIGTEGNGCNIINNNNGNVYLEDYESKNKILLSNSLYKLILNLQLR